MTQALPFKTAHEQLADVARQVVKEDTAFIGELIRIGQPPEPSAMDLHARMKAALNAYDVAVRTSLRAPISSLILAGVHACDVGDLAAAKKVLTTLSMVLDYREAPDLAPAALLPQ